MEPQLPVVSPGITPVNGPVKSANFLLNIVSKLTKYSLKIKIILVVGILVMVSAGTTVGVVLTNKKSPVNPPTKVSTSSDSKKSDNSATKAGSTTTKKTTVKTTTPTSSTKVSTSTTSSKKKSTSGSGGSGSSGGSGGSGGSSGGSSGGGSSPPAKYEHIISTLYAYPTLAPWTQVESAAPTVTYAIVDICDPNGHGSGCDGTPAQEITPDWATTITALKNAGITPLYYISSNYGATAISVIEGEIDNAVTWYGAPGPMFDEMQPSGTCTNGGSPTPCTTYYQTLYNYAVSKGATAVEYNPGSTYNVSTSDMFGTKEIIQLYEGSSADFETFSFPSWMANYSSNQFAATLSAGTSGSVGTDVTDAANDGIGYFYEDDLAEPNPNYATLPAFWSTELTDVKNVN